MNRDTSTIKELIAFMHMQMVVATNYIQCTTVAINQLFVIQSLAISMFESAVLSDPIHCNVQHLGNCEVLWSRFQCFCCFVFLGCVSYKSNVQNHGKDQSGAKKNCGSKWKLLVGKPSSDSQRCWNTRHVQHTPVTYTATFGSTELRLKP